MSLHELRVLCVNSVSLDFWLIVKLANIQNQSVRLWDISPGSRVLELCCGQGDTTTELGNGVGPTGHVDAVDPGSPDYGNPPLKDAQDDVLSSPVGFRISFHHATATSYATSYTAEAYD